MLTGLSQGVYVGTKLFDAEKPRITGLDVSSAKVGAKVTIMGANFGDQFEGQRVELDGTPVRPEAASLKPDRMQFVVPKWASATGTKVVAVKVVVREVPSVNETRITVEP